MPMIDGHKTEQVRSLSEEDHEHGDWDQGGYCNRLVMRDGAADTCGYRRPYAEAHPEDMGDQPGVRLPDPMPKPVIHMVRLGSDVRVTCSMSHDGVTSTSSVEGTVVTADTAIETRNQAIQQCAEGLAWMLA